MFIKKNRSVFVVLCLCVVIVLFLTTCNSNRDQAMTVRLQVLDRLLESNPQAVLDSLDSMDTDKISTFNKGYCALIKTIALDKTYHEFTSDTLISTGLKHLHFYCHLKPQHYARALLYQGLVRYRMGIVDSTAYAPLKEAIKTGDNAKQKDYNTLNLAAYFLGKIHDENKNLGQADYYFNKANHFAREISDSLSLFYNYYELAWNRLASEKMSEAKLYIDTLMTFTHLSESEQIEKENTVAAYYYHSKEYQKALDLELEYFDAESRLGPSEMYRTHYRLYLIYEALGNYDKAYYHLKMSVEQRDVTQNFNHLLYYNLGELSEQLQHHEEALDAYRTAYELQKKTTENRLNKHILELEKRYDYTEMEVHKLQAEKQRYFISIIATFIILILLSLLIWHTSRSSKRKNRLLVFENEKNRLAMENEYLQLQEEQNMWSRELLLLIARQSEAVEQLLYKINMIIRNHS